jgi:hypothetical protein
VLKVKSYRVLYSYVRAKACNFSQKLHIHRPLQHFVSAYFGLEHFNAEPHKAFEVEALVYIFRYVLELVFKKQIFTRYGTLYRILVYDKIALNSGCFPNSVVC